MMAMRSQARPQAEDSRVLTEVSALGSAEHAEHAGHAAGADGVRDPVCGMKVDPRTAAHRHAHHGRIHYFRQQRP